MKVDLSKKTALRFVVLLGIVSLFADMTYEGMRSIAGNYLAFLGATGTVVGLVAGIGELVGYGLRLVSGLISDKTHKYWVVTFFGYVLNLFAVPALALTGNWQWAAILMIAERTGKAFRNPPRDAMLSHATSEMGRGWGFGLHEAMDQTGAMLGPLIVSLILFLKGGYHEAFAVLLIPAIFSITTLLIARFQYPNPTELESVSKKLESKGLQKSFWLYLIAGACVALGYAHFTLIAFHFEKVGSVATAWTPIFYSVAMGIAAITALFFGRLFDKFGFAIFYFAFFLAAFSSPFLFFGGFSFALIGMILWGIGMGVQDSLLKAALSNIVPSSKRGTAFGIFDTGFGIAWFVGSVAMGILYDRSIPLLVGFSVASQLIALPLFLLARRYQAS